MPELNVSVVGGEDPTSIQDVTVQTPTLAKIAVMLVMDGVPHDVSELCTATRMLPTAGVVIEHENTPLVPDPVQDDSWTSAGAANAGTTQASHSAATRHPSPVK